VVRERRAWNLQLRLDIADDHALGMSRQQQSHDPQPGLGTERREPVGASNNLIGPHRHNSTILEI